MVFTHELLMYQKSNEWVQGTREISDAKTASAQLVYKALSMWYCVYFMHTGIKLKGS